MFYYSSVFMDKGTCFSAEKLHNDEYFLGAMVSFLTVLTTHLGCAKRFFRFAMI
jgi:hypothetical protein